MKKITALIFACSVVVMAAAQSSQHFPQHYFRNPLNNPIHLAGGFGEVRPNHFHTGIDIKTEGRIGLPVHAAADGYISRINISSRGYGNALYVTHPNGYTTVYGHLHRFYAKLQHWMIDQQYAQKKWAIQLFPKPGEFPVKKGQVIAWSGATGGVTGPHLHFEIRNTKTQHVLNELLFGLPFHDQRYPKAEAVAVYNGTESIYMQSPLIKKLVYLGHHQYRPKHQLIIVHNPQCFVGIEAQDYTDASRNWIAVYRLKLFMDATLQASTVFRELDFSLARYANAYGDYKTKKDKGVWFQSLYRLPNNKIRIYNYMNKDNGKLNLSDGRVHHARIELYDVAGHKTTVTFNLKYVKNKAADSTHLVCSDGLYWNCHSAYHYQDSDFRFKTTDHSFYDDICFKFKKEANPNGLTDKFQVMNVDIPIQEACTIGLKIHRKLPKRLQSKIAFVHHIKPERLPGNNPQSGMAAHFDDGWATASVRTFGNYYAVLDTIPPKIISYQHSGTFHKGQAIRFKASDAITSVASFEGYLDGKWLRFVRRHDTYTYRVDSHCPRGHHVLIVKATDENGNESQYRLEFTR